jgi:hypothetical protein
MHFKHVSLLGSNDAMTDLATIGTLAASALALAGNEAIKGFVGEVGKDAWKALKNTLAPLPGVDVEALEKNPSSTAVQSAIAVAVDGQPPEERASVKALVVALVEALKSEVQNRGGAGPVGLVVQELEAKVVNLEEINVTAGAGGVFERVKTDEFRVRRIDVQQPPGKTER